MKLLAVFVLAVHTSAFQFPPIDLRDAPPVSPACAAAESTISGDPAVIAASSKVNGADQSAANQAAFAKCGNEISSKKTCHATLDWSPYKSDVDILAAAAQKVDSTAKLCFLDFNLTSKADVLGEIKVFEKMGSLVPIPASCTTADRNIYLEFIRNQTLLNPNITAFSPGWNDPACATAPAKKVTDGPKDCQTLGSTTNCSVVHPHSYCGVSAEKAAQFTDGTGCSCNWGYDVKDAKCVQTPAPGPSPAPGPAGTTCKSASGGAMSPCPSGDMSCCDGVPGVGQSCYNSDRQECCVTGPGKGHVCAKGKCSTLSGYICT